jgi:hypothetical protein
MDGEKRVSVTWVGHMAVKVYEQDGVVPFVLGRCRWRGGLSFQWDQGRVCFCVEEGGGIHEHVKAERACDDNECGRAW